MWWTLTLESGEGLSFLFVDDEGTRMHAFVDNFYHGKKFKGLLQEGQWKMITGFKVLIVEKEIRMTKERKEIALTIETQVDDAEPFHGFIPLDLIPFQDVQNGMVHGGTSYTRDFLGVIDSVQDLGVIEDDSIPRNRHNNDPKTTTMINFVLQDNDGYHLRCRVKGPLANWFKRYWLIYGESGTIICLLTNWRVVGRDGAIQVEDAGDVSTFEYDPDGRDKVEHFTNVLLEYDEMSDQ
ncbi:unnamed protein product [Microthlaspi erraticum]|uniref:Replication protein A 70 kDa DNA-binding subunit B/D first OB fold domain-containing protein n=1 Tax=Microthlaspi erraticum TaxID=1685480 RepID=A0A6D2ISF5_9BRAS|nr:unnamed protein product [Microthlaspi erraticum]